jgi:hypothetical protein
MENWPEDLWIVDLCTTIDNSKPSLYDPNTMWHAPDTDDASTPAGLWCHIVNRAATYPESKAVYKGSIKDKESLNFGTVWSRLGFKKQGKDQPVYSDFYKEDDFSLTFFSE